MKQKNQVPILIADDDMDDCKMIKEALQESHLLNKLYFVHDGEDLLNYLHHKGRFADGSKYPLPGLILLDLNMPKKDGREALTEIKGDVRLRSIPIVVLTTSQAEEDVYRTYNLGVNSFITKPVIFNALVQVMAGIGQYWFEIVKLPSNSDKGEK